MLLICEYKTFFQIKYHSAVLHWKQRRRTISGVRSISLYDADLVCVFSVRGCLLSVSTLSSENVSECLLSVSTSLSSTVSYWLYFPEPTWWKTITEIRKKVMEIYNKTNQLKGHPPPYLTPPTSPPLGVRSQRAILFEWCTVNYPKKTGFFK